MTSIVPVKGVSGKIYRFGVVAKASDLPAEPGLFCFVYPLRYPGAPLESVYLGRAVYDLKAEVVQNELRAAAIEAGAHHIGFMEVDSRLARRRIYSDLIEVLPDSLAEEAYAQASPTDTRASRVAR